MKLKLPAFATKPVSLNPEEGLRWWVLTGHGTICTLTGFRTEWQATNHLWSLRKGRKTKYDGEKWVVDLDRGEVQRVSKVPGTEEDAIADARKHFKFKTVEVVNR